MMEMMGRRDDNGEMIDGYVQVRHFLIKSR